MWQKTKNLYHLAIAILSNIWFKFPSLNLIVIGVTGTDGKTTTASLIYHILNIAGFNTSMVSSVGAIIGGKNFDIGLHVTTPSSFALQSFLRKAVGEADGKKPNYLVLETTSHALDQFRVFGIKYDVGVLTNVTHEHLDYHKTYDNYVKTKAKLLKMSKVGIINKDDESYSLLNSQIRNSKLRTYGLGRNADINPINFPFKINLFGEYNKYNALAAISACKALGVSDADIRKGISTFKLPLGRADVISKKDFTVMIDFAHTPNAIDQILGAVRPVVKGKIIHVFGSAGLRDIAKRSIMGKMSSKYSNVIVLTAEDPRKESVEKIMDEIASGIQNSPSASSGSRAESREKFKIQSYNSKFKITDGKCLFKIPDRKEAIKAAIGMAKKGDFVILTGKSHEKSMNYGKGEEPWDEYAVARQALKLRND